jgi:hypothetical protein
MNEMDGMDGMDELEEVGRMNKLVGGGVVGRTPGRSRGAPRGRGPIRRSAFPGVIFGSRDAGGTPTPRWVAVVGWFGGACRELARSLHGACSELAGELGGGLGDSGYLGQAELGGPERVGIMD